MSQRRLSFFLACLVASCSSSHDIDADGRATSAGRHDHNDDDDQSASSSKKSLTYYEDVKPIIDSKCTQCHVDGGIGPLPLTSFDEVTLVKELVALDVSKGKM